MAVWCNYQITDALFFVMFTTITQILKLDGLSSVTSILPFKKNSVLLAGEIYIHTWLLHVGKSTENTKMMLTQEKYRREYLRTKNTQCLNVCHNQGRLVRVSQTYISGDI